MQKFNSATNRVSETSNTDDGLVYVSTRKLIELHHAAQSLKLEPTSIRANQSGGYVSAFKGRGMEFDEVRPYQQGDDVRTIDWRVTARTGQPHTKLFREERERSVMLWVDMRQSMFFATQGAYKSVRAAQVAGLLGWSANHHGDRLGGLIFSDTEHQELRPKSGKPPLLHILNRLSKQSSRDISTQAVNDIESAAALQQSLARLRLASSTGSLIFLISDFSQLNSAGLAHISQLSQHNDLVLIHLYDPIETELPPPGQYQISDGQQTLSLDSSSDDFRYNYKQRFERHQAQLQQLAHRPGIYMLPLSTEHAPLLTLQQHFGRRS
jgi:uncharacterized protein (DUF58 family)